MILSSSARSFVRSLKIIEGDSDYDVEIAHAKISPIRYFEGIPQNRQ
ncbi:MAG: hypothetical protein KME54_05620 [Tolypothrix brevis GSE-NOS-MK-07-07A]|nr:hypothetical protein [Tolypothrix brevis GSE-NOS-MK-07-07A]